MAREKNVRKIIKELGYEPKEHACIVANYAPDDSLGSKLIHFFTLEYYIMQLCEEEIVFLPLKVIFFAGMFPKKEIALRIPYDTLQSVKITEVNKLNYEVTFTTDTDTICLSVQNKEWSEFRASGTIATGNSFLNVGVLGAATDSWKSINWHRQNIDNTFSLLQNLPQYSVS